MFRDSSSTKTAVATWVAFSAAAVITSPAEKPYSTAYPTTPGNDPPPVVYVDCSEPGCPVPPRPPGPTRTVNIHWVPDPRDH
jgi:hypothetical protein